ncbi:hypothetical protein [Cytobacillus purgationiresistens]|uniref:Glycosyltransferase n=1 Tax=Cytobacillus purgationiresistens TaxID=863449 RepID=A0ABU0ADV0_9BACI|nr:hypothetical protein [Cytobacillus purgationiresistens]MDQ0268280.1 hypothetical protein [Cytobacillus purgationiresistens]
MKIIHTIPLLIRPEFLIDDLEMAKRCFETLQPTKGNPVVLYNQGGLNNDEIRELFPPSESSVVILGNGENVGIAQARQNCFDYIWEHYEDVEYISEIHVDMLFPPNWYGPLVEFLTNSDEPMISPGILTMNGELQPLNLYTAIPDNTDDLIALLGKMNRDEVHERFVHPVIHKASILRVIGGYDTRFLQGKQGYEDDSLLLGYAYYMGTRTNWRPKCYLKSWVYHATMAQRGTFTDRHLDFSINEQGLIRQYGAYGLKRLSNIHQNSSVFDMLLQDFLRQ